MVIGFSFVRVVVVIFLGFRVNFFNCNGVRKGFGSCGYYWILFFFLEGMCGVECLLFFVFLGVVGFWMEFLGC